VDFNSQDLQRFQCSLLLIGDKNLKNFDQEFLHFFSSAGGLHNTLAAFLWLFQDIRTLLFVGGMEMGGG
jgi:hypothetical protein